MELDPLPSKEVIRDRGTFRCVIFTRDSIPGLLISDYAPEFLGIVISKLCEFNNIVVITPYHSTSKGLVEQANQKLLNYLCQVLKPQHKNWDVTLCNTQFAVNATVYASAEKTNTQTLYGH